MFMAIFCIVRGMAKLVMSFPVQVGDWGRQNNEDQAKAAKLMGDVAECMGPLFVISTGDNFYPSEYAEGASRRDGVQVFVYGSEVRVLPIDHFSEYPDGLAGMTRVAQHGCTPCASYFFSHLAAALQVHMVPGYAFFQSCSTVSQLSLLCWPLLLALPGGLTSVDDVNFQQSFTNVYKAPGLQVPWFAVLGNHGKPICHSCLDHHMVV